MKYYISLFLLATIISGCASLKVQYDERNPDLPAFSEHITIAVWDQREQIRDGSRKTDFVGYVRSLAGIAYPIGTLSGNPFSDDISSTISSSLEDKGCSTSIITTLPIEDENVIFDNFNKYGKGKLFLMKCLEHKIDGYGLPILHFDLQVKIYSLEGKQISEKNYQGERNLGESVGWGKNFKKYKEPISEGLEDLLEEIFNDPEILEALNYFGTKQEHTEIINESKPESTITVSQISNTTSNEFDVIYLNNGSEIKSKVVEITNETIKYKNFDQLDGPIRNIFPEDVFMIIYQNGSREILKN